MTGKQKILVTGGAGYIGSHTVVALAEAGFEPVIVDSFANSTEQALQGIARILGREVTCHKADCTDENRLREILKVEGKVAGAIHFAAYKAVGESVKEPLKYYQNNLGSLVALLKVLAEQGGAGVVFSSSATVYGDPTELPLTEEMPHGKAISPYAATKQMSEQILQDATATNPALKASILRYFNPIGAHPSANIGELPLGVPNNLVPFITQTAAGLREHLTVFGEDYPTPDGTCIRDYIHVQDLAAAHVAALHRLLGGSAPASEIINIGTGKGNSVLELIKTFEAVTGEKLNYKIGERRPGDVPILCAEVSKAKELLGWEAKHNLAEALTDAWRWQQSLSTDKENAGTDSPTKQNLASVPH